LRQELRQQAWQLHLRQRHRHAGTYQPTRLGTEAIHHLARGLRLGQHGLGMPVHAHADVGDGKAARGTLQQAHAQLVFQLADAPAQARLGNAQCPLGGREAAVVHHHCEVVEVVEVLHGLIPKMERTCEFNHLYPEFTNQA